MSENHDEGIEELKKVASKPLDPKITHYKQMRNSIYLGHWDLPQGRDFTLKIREVLEDTVYDRRTNGNKDVYVLTFHNAEKRLILNETNKAAVASHHGANPHEWPEKEIQLYRTTDRVRREQVECIRIRPAKLKSTLN